MPDRVVCKICYPEDDAAILTNGSGDRHMLIAFGHWINGEVEELESFIEVANQKRIKGNQLKFPSKTFHWHYDWAYCFRGVPLNQFVKLVVRYKTSDGDERTHMHCILLHGQKPLSKPAATVTIAYPPPPSPDPQHVPQNFTAFGTANPPPPGTKMKAWLVSTVGGTPIDGVPLTTAPTGMNWAYNFTTTMTGSHILSVSATPAGGGTPTIVSVEITIP